MAIPGTSTTPPVRRRRAALPADESRAPTGDETPFTVLGVHLGEDGCAPRFHDPAAGDEHRAARGREVADVRVRGCMRALGDLFVATNRADGQAGGRIHQTRDDAAV